jgi:hypothetical protein
MDAEAVAAMLREDRAEWDALVAVLEAHPDESLHGAGSPAWTSRDVYAHLARWMEHSTADLEARLAGRSLPQLEGTDDEINARWQAEDSGLSLGEARERARRAFERRLQVVEAVPSDRWDEELEKIARYDGAEHYAGHRRSIVVG